MGLVIRGPYFHVASSGVKDWYSAYWDVAHGCSKLTAGCDNCAAAEVLGRMGDATACPPDRAGKAAWTGRIDVYAEALAVPALWTTPKLVFVCPWSDLFHPLIPDSFRDQVWDIMAAHPAHRFVLSTKRATDMRIYVERRACPENVGLMVSVEDATVRYRIGILLDTPAPLRGVSAEPLLGPVNIRHYLGPGKIDWIVAGPELGIAQRPCEVDWMRQLRDDAAAAGIPFFTKHELDGRDHQEHPDW